MKKNVLTRVFDNEQDMNAFFNEYVGDKYYWQIRPHWVKVDGLTVTIAMQYSGYFHSRFTRLIDNGFVHEGRKDV